MPMPMPISYEFAGYSLGKWWWWGGGDLTFKILKAFLFYYRVHSANGGGASFVPQIQFQFTVHW